MVGGAVAYPTLQATPLQLVGAGRSTDRRPGAQWTDPRRWDADVGLER
jgi:hypothetical protein